MQGIKIPTYMAKEIDCANNNFFWKNNLDSDNWESSIPLISWDKICRLKCEGGLGIQKVQDTNASLLAKLGRKVITEPNNIWVQVVSAKYLSKVNFLDTKKNANASTMWKYILDHRYLIKRVYVGSLGMVKRSISGTTFR